MLNARLQMSDEGGFFEVTVFLLFHCYYFAKTKTLKGQFLKGANRKTRETNGCSLIKGFYSTPHTLCMYKVFLLLHGYNNVIGL